MTIRLQGPSLRFHACWEREQHQRAHLQQFPGTLPHVPCGYALILNQGTAGFGQCLHVPGFHFGHLVLTIPVFQELNPHSFQSSFFSQTGRFPWVSGGFLERRTPGKNGEGTPRRVSGRKGSPNKKRSRQPWKSRPGASGLRQEGRCGVAAQTRGGPQTGQTPGVGNNIYKGLCSGLGAGKRNQK